MSNQLIQGKYRPDDVVIQFPAVLSGRTVTHDEAKSLLRGERIPWSAISKSGKPYSAYISLKKEDNKWGFEFHNDSGSTQQDNVVMIIDDED